MPLKGYALPVLGSILAGLAIGIAGTVFLRVPNPLVGSWLFGFGLLTIVVLKFNLFTGAIGSLAIQGKNTPRYALDCIIIWLGNLVRTSRVFPRFETRILNMVAEKLADGPLSTFILAFFCAMLMYLAVDTYKKEDVPPPVRLAMLFLCVVVFILSGFEHCIANMYDFAVTCSFNDPHTWVWLAIMTADNACGGILIPAVNCLRK